MSIWLQWFNILYPVALTITPIILLMGFLWLQTKFASLPDLATCKADIVTIQTKLTAVDLKLEGLGKDDTAEPTRIDLMKQLGELGRRLSHLEAAAEGDRRQMTSHHHAISRSLDTLQNYVHTLVEQNMGKGNG